MSDLTKVEKAKLRKLFATSDGSILKFNNCGFEQFFLLNIEIYIYEDKYTDFGKSQVARLTSFWDKENNNIVGKSISNLLQELKHQKRVFEASPLYWCGYEGDEILDFDQKLFNECSSIAQRLIGNEEIEEITLATPYFEKIEQEIIEAIDNAEFTIWVAVAWFTNQKLFDHLVAKKNQGVNVQLIILDDEINRNSGLSYEQEFEIHRCPKFGKYKNNIFHVKYCIIDLKQVIHGCYNWTNRANYNDENVVNDKNRKIAEDYAKHFIKSKNKAKILRNSMESLYF